MRPHAPPEGSVRVEARGSACHRLLGLLTGSALIGSGVDRVGPLIGSGVDRVRLKSGLIVGRVGSKIRVDL